MNQALRKPVSRNPKKRDTSPMWSPAIFIGFALLCFITSFIMGGDTSFKMSERVPTNGGLIGPIKVKKDNSVFEIKAKQSIPYGNNSYVTAELLDENKKYLFSFGKEFWAESGYDSDGRWTESDTDVSSKFTIKKAGIYYLKFTSEKTQGVISDIKVDVSRKRGSSLPHLVAGIFGLLIGVFLYYTNMNAAAKKKFIEKSAGNLAVFVIVGLVLALEFFL